MKLVALGDVCEISIGRTPARAKSTYWGSGTPWLSIADMNQGRNLTATKEQITELAVDEARCKIVPAGTVVLSFKLSIGKVGIVRTPMATNEAIAALVPRDPTSLLPEYLAFALASMDLSGGANRAAMGGTLNKKSLAGIRLPLPSVDEQRRIADILDNADALRARRREVIAHLDALSQSVFHEMFDNTGNWETLPLDSLAIRERGSIRTGPFGSQLLTSEFTPDGIAVLGIDNTVGNTFGWRERRYISPTKYEQLKRYTVRPGDLIVTIMGTLGRCAVVPDDIPVAINTKHLCCITLDHAKVEPRFLHAYFLHHPVAAMHLRQTTKGSIMAGLNMGIIKAMPVALPPLELQHEFARRAESVERLKATHRAELAELDKLFLSLQNRAFKGEL